MPCESQFQFTGAQLDDALADWALEQDYTGSRALAAQIKRRHVAEFFASDAAEALLQKEGTTRE